jgi:hypothetical protein
MEKESVDCALPTTARRRLYPSLYRHRNSGALQVLDATRSLLEDFLTKDGLLQLSHLLVPCFQDQEILLHYQIHQGTEDKARTFGEKTLCGEIVLNTEDLCLGLAIQAKGFHGRVLR